MKQLRNDCFVDEDDEDACDYLENRLEEGSGEWSHVHWRYWPASGCTRILGIQPAEREREVRATKLFKVVSGGLH